ncbi:MAG TPA: ABC transporter permease, partial [Vicinamibacterales bacterium]|nr:ABC transporter permease [Vicinamibacterales bacterium]
MVVLSLALGIGANVTIFGAINGLLLRTLPGVDRPESLVRLQSVGENEMISDVNTYGYSEKDDGQPVGSTFSYATFAQLKRSNDTLADLFACAPEAPLNVVVNGRGEVATGLVASGSYFQTLGVRAAIGRTLIPDDDRGGAPPVAVLSDGYWKRRFGGDPNAIGTVLHVNTVPITVVGVTPPAFVGVQEVLSEATDITMPLELDRQFNHDAGLDVSRLDRPAWAWLQVVGRLKPGATPAHVQGNLGGVYEQAARAGWQSYLGS